MVCCNCLSLDILFLFNAREKCTTTEAPKQSNNIAALPPQATDGAVLELKPRTSVTTLTKTDKYIENGRPHCDSFQQVLLGLEVYKAALDFFLF